MPRQPLPLVSILIPAFNAERWIGDTIRSALSQTWRNKEIIIVDDGSTDNTAAIARSFQGPNLTVVLKRNEGAAATRNHAYRLAKGQYIQWLDADDLLSPSKIERQLNALADPADDRLLLSAAWGYFAYRPHRARFTPTALWANLSPLEWLLYKMEQSLHMQTATWLTSRALAEAAGAWDTRLLSDDDGEYFCRVLLASRGVHFVADSKVYYRSVAAAGRLSFIGTSDRKMRAMLLSMQLHIRYLRSLEQSERVEAACLRYIANWRGAFDPAREDLHAELSSLVASIGGGPSTAVLRPKYSWLAPLLGARAAWQVQIAAPALKARALCRWDQLMHGIDVVLARSSELKESPPSQKQAH
jgi:glycosyltransferase involved in cell wall biosynthesis